jgi:hypothetical protein
MARQDKKTEPTTSELSSQAVALAEQLGRIAGTIEGTAEAWLNRASLTEQLTKVRDGATRLLNTLAGSALRGRKSAQLAATKQNRGRAASRTVDLAHAPGKKHRKPSPSKPGVKHSDERISKARTAEAIRHRRKSFA